MDKVKYGSNGLGQWKCCVTLNYRTLWDEKVDGDNGCGGNDNKENKKEENWSVVVKFLQRVLSPCIR